MECKICGKTLIKNQKSTCSIKCRSEWVNSLNRGKPSWNKGKTGWSVGTSAGFQKGHIGFLNGESREKSTENHKGEKHWRWKGGITPLVLQIRHCLKYKEWVRKVFNRDSYLCVDCGSVGYLQSHHIKSFSSIFNENKITSLDDAEKCEAFWDITNGVSLCKKCHKLRHKEYTA